MKQPARLLALSAVMALSLSVTQPTGFWAHPALRGHDSVYACLASVYRTAPAVCKTLSDLNRGTPAADWFNAAHVHLARAINTFAFTGVALKHLRSVVIVHGPSTPIMLIEKADKANYRHVNLNRAEPRDRRPEVGRSKHSRRQASSRSKACADAHVMYPL